MLGEHFDDLAITDAVVEVVTQLDSKGVEGSLLSGIGRIL
jgi:hypothetical protein